MSKAFAALAGFLGVAFLSAAAFAGETAPQPLTADWVNAQLARQDAKTVVTQLDTQNRFEELLDNVGDGGSDWIQLAAKLAPGADAGSAEGLSMSLAFALPKNAPAVIAVLNSTSPALDAKNVCDAPFIEDMVEDIPGYLKQAQAAVQKITDPAVEPQKADCLAQLKATDKLFSSPPAP